MAKIKIDVSTQELKRRLAKLHESDIANIFEDHTEERTRIFNILGIKKFSEVFLMLSDDLQVSFYKTLTTDQKKSLLKCLEADDLKIFIELFKVKEHLAIINLLPKTTQNIVNQLLAYEVGSSASISSPHYILLPIDISVKEATSYVTTESSEKDEVDVIFFHDENKAYLGAITLHQLITARANQRLTDIYDDAYPYSFEEDAIAKSIKKIRDYDLDMLPILNNEHQLIGVITAEDALSIMEDIHFDTIVEMVKVHEVDEADSPLKRSLIRLPWLLISAILNIVIASFLVIFQGTLEANVALVLFQPMILGMAGNIGTQSISVTILGLHQEKIKPLKHITKELSIGLINSFIAGVIGVVIVYGFLTILPTEYQNLNRLAITVGLSLGIAMFISALAGVLLPFILRKFGADEKAASGPLISTINDFTALGVYFLIATWLLMTI